MPSLIRLYAAVRRPSVDRNTCERAVPMRVPPYPRMSQPGRRFEQRALRRGEARRAHLRKPTAHIIPSNAHDIAPLESPPAGAVTRPITQETAVAEAQIIDERRIAYLDVERRREVGRIGSLPFCVAADKAFISFSDDPRLTSSAEFAHITFSLPMGKKEGGRT